MRFGRKKLLLSRTLQNARSIFGKQPISRKTIFETAPWRRRRITKAPSGKIYLIFRCYDLVHAACGPYDIHGDFPALEAVLKKFVRNVWNWWWWEVT